MKTKSINVIITWNTFTSDFHPETNDFQLLFTLDDRVLLSAGADGCIYGAAAHIGGMRIMEYMDKVVVVLFFTFKITIRCIYNLGQLSLSL